MNDTTNEYCLEQVHVRVCCRVTVEAWPLTWLATHQRLSPADCRSHLSLRRPTMVG